MPLTATQMGLFKSSIDELTNVLIDEEAWNLAFRPRCHPKAGLKTKYFVRESVLKLQCRKCSKDVISVLLCYGAELHLSPSPCKPVAEGKAEAA